MLPHAHLNIKNFACNFCCLYFTIIIIKLRPLSTTETYTTFQDLYVAVNIPASKKGYASLQNVLRKVKKGSYKKCKCNVIRGVFKAKGFGKRETAIRRDEFLFMIITTRDNKIKS